MDKVEFRKDAMGYQCCTPPEGVVITQMERTASGRYSHGGNRIKKFKKQPYDDMIIELHKQGFLRSEIANKIEIASDMVKSRLRKLRIQGLIL